MPPACCRGVLMEPENLYGTYTLTYKYHLGILIARLASPFLKKGFHARPTTSIYLELIRADALLRLGGGRHNKHRRDWGGKTNDGQGTTNNGQGGRTQQQGVAKGSEAGRGGRGKAGAGARGRSQSGRGWGIQARATQS